MGKMASRAFAFGLVAILLIVGLKLSKSADSSNSPLLFAGQFAFLAGPPSNHDSVIFSATWTKPITRNENALADCYSETENPSSQCVAIVPLDAPSGATHAVLKVKAKSWVTNELNTSGLNRAVIYASAPVQGYIADDFIYTESSGHGPDGQGEDRRVEYSNVIVPIVNNSITIQVGREISGKSIVELVVYLAGYTEVL